MTRRSMKLSLQTALAILTLFQSVDAEERITPGKGDKIVLIGNTLAERMQYFNHWETRLHTRFPDKNLTVRNLGWSGDSITTRLRSLSFQNHGHTLIDHQPNLILAMFGFNESFAGEKGLEAFERELAQFLDKLSELKYPSQNFRGGSYTPRIQDKEGTPNHKVRIVLISPIANEDIPNQEITAATDNNPNLRRYVATMKRVAKSKAVPFVDLFTPTLQLYQQTPQQLTINGIHLNSKGYQALAEILDQQLFGPQTESETDLAALREEISEKNLQFFYDHRAVNGFYIYGGRQKPFGTLNFPAEFQKLRNMTRVRDQRVWSVSRGESIPTEIDDSKTGDFVKVESNFQREISITSPKEALQAFATSDDFEVNLWASEEEFEDLVNPVQFTFDGKGRMFVTTMPSYPMYLPGTPVDDKVLILEDSDSDGRADTQKVFARGLHLPTGIELAHGGAFVAAQPNLLFIQDTNGDDVADNYQIRLHGFDSADSHHAISAFELGPGGGLFLQEGTFLHTQVETRNGPVRVANSALYRYEPRTEMFNVFVSYNFVNPWGLCFDRWGQSFIADASDGGNYWGTAISSSIEHPRKHSALKQILRKQWRPTCGCEIVSSRHFPQEMQGNYLLNNCIGFQGVLQYRLKEDGSGYRAETAPPLLRSTDPNFRPVDLQFGPDGALYILDWFNPLVGHIQHSLRDPNRDKSHGRIWRVTYKNNPLITPIHPADLSTDDVIETLKSFEDRTRFRARRELGSRKTAEVVAAVNKAILKVENNKEADQHFLLELLWVKQNHNAIDSQLLDRILSSDDPRARSAAIQVLCHWRNKIDEPLTKLQTAIHDEHPRVRLEAIRALSFFDSPKALEIAVESLIYDQDDYLEYMLKETMETLDIRIKSKAAKSSPTD